MQKMTCYPTFQALCIDQTKCFELSCLSLLAIVFSDGLELDEDGCDANILQYTFAFRMLVQRSAKIGAPGLVNFIIDVAYQLGGPSGKDGLRRRTITNLTVNATSQIFTTGAS